MLGAYGSGLELIEIASVIFAFIVLIVIGAGALFGVSLVVVQIILSIHDLIKRLLK